MKFNVEINIFGKIINAKGVEAQNEFEAENIVKDLVNRKIKFKAKSIEVKQDETVEMLKGMFNMK